MKEPARENKTADHADEEEKKQSRAAKMLRKVGSASSRALNPVLSPVRSIASKSKQLLISPNKKKPDNDDIQRQSLAFEDLLESAQIDKARLNELCKDWDLMDSNYDGLVIHDEHDGDSDNIW